MWLTHSPIHMKGIMNYHSVYEELTAVDVRNVWSYTAMPLYAFIVLWLIEHTVNYIFVWGTQILFVCFLSERCEVLP
jgi:hypothetical protein